MACPLLSALVAYWALDEASGTRFDSHGLNDLSDNNTVGSAAGIISTSADFELDNQEYLSIASNPSLVMGDIDFTVQAWVKFESLPGPATIISKWASPPSIGEYSLSYDPIGNHFHFSVAKSLILSASVEATNFGAASLGTWYLVHGWHDSVNNLIGISVNGGTPNTTAYSDGVSEGSNPFQIGKDDGIFFFMDGLIDEVGIWKRVLSASERNQLYNGGFGTAYSAFCDDVSSSSNSSSTLSSSSSSTLSSSSSLSSSSTSTLSSSSSTSSQSGSESSASSSSSSSESSAGLFPASAGVTLQGVHGVGVQYQGPRGAGVRKIGPFSTGVTRTSSSR